MGHIRIVDTLGVGGMGEVYVGWDEALERRVALKAIRKRHRMRPEVKARFLREARVLSQLDHPNICRIYDYVAGEDRDFLVLELIEGKSLGRVIKGDGEASGDRGLDDARRLEIAEGIAEALATAHAKGVVHRDLKPANVMITGEGVVKVLDFGIARSIGPPGGEAPPEPGGATPPEEAPGDATGPAPGDSTAGATLLELPARLPDAGGDPMDPEADGGETTLGVPAGRGASAETPAEKASRFAAGEAIPADPRSWTVHGSVLGSPGYLSPEQAHGEPATTASDMYVFGLLLQELFTGRPPYPPDLSVAQLVLRAQKGERVPLEGVRSDVAGLIDDLLDPAAAARPTAVQTLERIRWIRDLPRRRLIRGAIAAVVLLLVLSGVKYTLDLKAARDVAQLHRAQAEDLIGFMLGDLRDKLSDVGRLELLEDVGDQALDYFESLPVEDRTDSELFRRSKALRQIGEVRIAQGDLPAAMEAFDEAEELSKNLLQRGPEHGEWVLGLGHSHYWKGNVHWLQGDMEAALDQFQRYDDLTRKLVKAEPDESEWRLEEGYAATNLAAVHQRLGQENQALAELRRSLEIKRRLAAEDPDDAELKRSLATGLSWHGSLLLERGDLTAAGESFQQEEEIRRGLVAAEPENTDARRLMAFNASHRGELALIQGDVVASREAFRKARDLLADLVRHDPQNAGWQRHLVATDFRLCELALVEGRPEEARAALESGTRALAPLVQQDPTNTRLRRELARAEVLWARLLFNRGEIAAALDRARAALTGFEDLVAKSPKDRDSLHDLGESYLILGLIHARQGDVAKARATWQRGVHLLRPLVEKDADLYALATLSQCLLLLGRQEAAKPLVERLSAAGYGRPDVRRRIAEHGLELPARTGPATLDVTTPAPPGRSS